MFFQYAGIQLIDDVNNEVTYPEPELHSLHFYYQKKEKHFQTLVKCFFIYFKDKCWATILVIIDKVLSLCQYLAVVWSSSVIV